MSYYDILKVSKCATQEEIKRAYRGLTLISHPDSNEKDTSINFHTLQEAYNILGNEKTRQEYDGNTLEYHQPIEIMDDHEEMPEDVYHTLPVRLEDAFLGKSGIEIKVNVWAKQGEDDLKNHMILTFSVDVPMGINSGETIILKKSGNRILYRRSDILVKIVLLGHDKFIRNGFHVIYHKTITLKEALVGFTFDFIHLNSEKYTIHNRSGNIICDNYEKILPGLGFSNTHGLKGDLILHFHVQYPSSLSDEAINALKEISF
jgi:DnaJ family protein B protein 4